VIIPTNSTGSGLKEGEEVSRRIDNPVILINHWRWLEQQGPSYKRQAASCKRQASSLTRKHYDDIVSYKLKEK
jgi:hypothetical protein